MSTGGWSVRLSKSTGVMPRKRRTKMSDGSESTQVKSESEMTPVMYVPASAIHKSVKNILANEMGITTEKIVEMINNKVEAAVMQRVNQLFEAKNMDAFIAKQVGLHLGATSWDSTPMKSVIQTAIQRHIQDLVNTSLTVQLNLNHNPEVK